MGGLNTHNSKVNIELLIIYCNGYLEHCTVESNADTSVLDGGGELIEGALGDVRMLAVAVVEVELLKFLDPDHESVNALSP